MDTIPLDYNSSCFAARCKDRFNFHGNFKCAMIAFSFKFGMSKAIGLKVSLRFITVFRNWLSLRFPPLIQVCRVAALRKTSDQALTVSSSFMWHLLMLYYDLIFL